MTAYTERRTLLVPASQQDVANDVAHVLDPDMGGANTFRVGCSPDGAEPATHYVCSVMVTPETASLLDDTDAGPMFTALQQLATARGRTLTPNATQVQDLRDSLVISTGEIGGVLAEGGLQFVQSE